MCSNIFLRNMLTSDTLYGNSSNMPRDLIFPSSQVLHARPRLGALAMQAPAPTNAVHGRKFVSLTCVQPLQVSSTAH